MPLLLAGLGAFSVLVFTLSHFVPLYLRSAKTSEPRNELGLIGKLALEAYERDGHLCASASAPVPRSLVAVRARNYQSPAAEWSVDAPANAGFACLGFEMPGPQYYQYDYRVGADGKTFTATARGDLDGDGRPSIFRLEGKIVVGKLEIDPVIDETAPEE